MAEFQYRIVTPEGKEKKGTIEADSQEKAVALLKAERNIVLSIQEASMLTKDISFSFGKKKVKPRDFSIFCRQIVSILKAGVSIIDALAMLADQTENPTLKEAIEHVHENVAKGEGLASAMRKENKVFPEMLCNMVDAGESSGNLEVAFERMAVQFEKDSQLKESVKKAMIYPIVVIVVMIAVLIIMLVVVIPNFMKMFEDLDTEMPAVTMAVVHMSDFVVAYWWLLIIIIAAIVFAYKAYAKTPSGKWALHGIQLKLPVFGELVVKTCCARLGRTLCTLLGAGVPMMEAIEITARNMDNVHYRKAMIEAKEQVARGVTLSRPLKSSGLFPPMVVHMVSIGEETGNIENMLENVANYYEEEVQSATEQLMTLIEPIIIVVMAVMVGFMIMAIMSPMFTLYEALG